MSTMTQSASSTSFDYKLEEFDTVYQSTQSSSPHIIQKCFQKAIEEINSAHHLKRCSFCEFILCCFRKKAKQIEKETSEEEEIKTALILKQYEPIFENYFQYQRLYSEHNLSLSTLKKVTQIAIKLHLEAEDNEIHQKGSLIHVKNLFFLARVQQGKIKIALYPGTPIRSGSFGSVTKTLEIISGTFLAFKTANCNQYRPKTDERNQVNEVTYKKNMGQSKIEMQNEVKMLYFINKNKQDYGFQHAPHMVVNIKTSECFQILGYLGRYYSTDLFEWIQTPATEQERIHYCKELVKIYQQMVDLKVVHSDIKLENIFIDGNQLRLGDFGSATRLDLPLGELKLPIWSIHYIHPSDVRALEEAIASRNEHAYKEVRMRIDLYAIGIVCFRILSAGELPYHQNKNQESEFHDYADEKSPFLKERLKSKGYDKSIIALIEKMVFHDSEDRIASEDAITGWASIT